MYGVCTGWYMVVQGGTGCTWEGILGWYIPLYMPLYPTTLGIPHLPTHHPAPLGTPTPVFVVPGGRALGSVLRLITKGGSRLRINFLKVLKVLGPSAQSYSGLRAELMLKIG